MGQMPNAGDKAPGFKLPNQSEKLIDLADFKGKKVVLYFYPKDNTPGCTAQACNLSDNYDALLKAGYVVLGVSPDSPKSHTNFIAKYDLPFDLLSDGEKEVLDKYGVWAEKKNYGRTYMGVVRTTFIIDENGVISDVIKSVNTKDHTSQILN